MARQRQHPCGLCFAAGESLQTEDGFEFVECVPGLGVRLVRPDRGGDIVAQPLFDSFDGQALTVLPEGFEGIGVELGGNQDSSQWRPPLGEPWAGAGDGVHECLVQGGPRCEAGEWGTVRRVKFGKDSGSLN